MSILVREWLKVMGLFSLTTHEDRVEIDREIEKRMGVYCDEAIDKGMISKCVFKEIVHSVLKGRKKPKRTIVISRK